MCYDWPRSYDWFSLNFISLKPLKSAPKFKILDCLILFACLSFNIVPNSSLNRQKLKYLVWQRYKLLYLTKYFELTAGDEEWIPFFPRPVVRVVS